MLYTRTQPPNILGSREEDFEVFFTIYRHGGNIVRPSKLICKIPQIPFQSNLYIEFGRKMATQFRREKYLKVSCIHAYSRPRTQGQIIPGNTIVIVTNCF